MGVPGNTGGIIGGPNGGRGVAADLGDGGGVGSGNGAIGVSGGGGRGRSTVATKRLRLLLLHGNSAAASLLLQVKREWDVYLGVSPLFARRCTRP